MNKETDKYLKETCWTYNFDTGKWKESKRIETDNKVIKPKKK